MATPMVARITTSAAIGGKPECSSVCRIAVFDALDELVVIALSVSQGLAGAVAAGAAGGGATGAAATATVGTVQRETAMAAAVNLRPNPDIGLLPYVNATQLKHPRLIFHN
jgi:hypothetical protein